MMHWYVMRSKPLKELFLYQQLGLHGIEAYIPLVPFRKKGAASQIAHNFFPGYLFIHVDLVQSGISCLMYIPGSNGVICFGGEPGVVPEAFIQQLKWKVNHFYETPQPLFSKYKKGDSIRIASGPFEGYMAVFDHYIPTADRVRIMLKTIAEYQVRLEIPSEQISR